VLVTLGNEIEEAVDVFRLVDIEEKVLEKSDVFSEGSGETNNNLLLFLVVVVVVEEFLSKVVLDVSFNFVIFNKNRYFNREKQLRFYIQQIKIKDVSKFRVSDMIKNILLTYSVMHLTLQIPCANSLMYSFFSI
jgi:hypothetical protein